MKNRHMRMREKCIRNLITHGIIFLGFVMSEKNITDLIIKGLIHQREFELSRRMRLKPIN